jgi:hypothetical protein
VDAHENGAAVALIESHSLNLAGLLFILARLVGDLAMDMPRVAAMSSIEKIAIELISYYSLSLGSERLTSEARSESPSWTTSVNKKTLRYYLIHRRDRGIHPGESADKLRPLCC